MKKFNHEKFSDYLDKFSYEPDDLTRMAVHTLTILDQKSRLQVIFNVSKKLNTTLYNQALILAVFENLLVNVDEQAAKDTVLSIYKKLKDKYPNAFQDEEGTTTT